MRATCKRCASRAFPLEGVRVQIASRRFSAGGSCTPGETGYGFPTRIFNYNKLKNKQP
jgi:hypothetical protein